MMEGRMRRVIRALAVLAILAAPLASRADAQRVTVGGCSPELCCTVCHWRIPLEQEGGGCVFKQMFCSDGHTDSWWSC